MVHSFGYAGQWVASYALEYGEQRPLLAADNQREAVLFINFTHRRQYILGSSQKRRKIGAN
jgi:hypothetical protein